MKGFVCTFAAISLLCGAHGASAQNLVTNPGFQDDLLGWSGPATFDGTRDDTGTPGSGSAHHVFVNGFDGLASQVSVGQCIPATPGTTYIFGGKVFIPGGQDLTTIGAVVFSFMSSDDCSVGSLFFDLESLDSEDATDTWVALSGGPHTAPAGTSRIWLRGSNGVFAMGTSEVNFDDFFVEEAEPVPSVPMLMTLALFTLLMAVACRTLRRRPVVGPSVT